MSLEAGFADPVHDAQRSFRAVLDAMSHPGRIAQVSGVTAPGPLGVAAGAVLLTLVDHETRLWIDPDAAAVRRWIEFHCGAQVVGDEADCAFALAIGVAEFGSVAGGVARVAGNLRDGYLPGCRRSRPGRCSG